MKKTNRIIALLLVVIMMTALSVSVFATETAGSDEQSENFKLVKYFKMPVSISYKDKEYV